MQSKPDKGLSLIIELMMFVGLHRGKCMDVFYFMWMSFILCRGKCMDVFYFLCRGKCMDVFYFSDFIFERFLKVFYE